MTKGGKSSKKKRLQRVGREKFRLPSAPIHMRLIRTERGAELLREGVGAEGNRKLCNGTVKETVPTG